MASIATRMGVIEIAAHQLILSMWLVIAFVQDAVGQAGQVLVSQQLGKSLSTPGEEPKPALVDSLWGAF